MLTVGLRTILPIAGFHLYHISNVGWYQNIVQPVLVPLLSQEGDVLFQRDNVSQHVTSATLQNWQTP